MKDDLQKVLDGVERDVNSIPAHLLGSHSVATEATLVERLRKNYNRAVEVAYRSNFPRATESDELMRDAADKIEELEARLARCQCQSSQ